MPMTPCQFASHADPKKAVTKLNGISASRNLKAAENLPWETPGQKTWSHEGPTPFVPTHKTALFQFPRLVPARPVPSPLACSAFERSNDQAWKRAALCCMRSLASVARCFRNQALMMPAFFPLLPWMPRAVFRHVVSPCLMCVFPPISFFQEDCVFVFCAIVFVLWGGIGGRVLSLMVLMSWSSLCLIILSGEVEFIVVGRYCMRLTNARSNVLPRVEAFLPPSPSGNKAAIPKSSDKDNMLIAVTIHAM